VTQTRSLAPEGKLESVAGRRQFGYSMKVEESRLEAPREAF
jgi:hypothetical protein